MNQEKPNELQLIIGTYYADMPTGWTKISFQQAGYIYEPYVPLYISPLIMMSVDVNKLQLVIGRKL